jgi:tagatose-1,6-bisphosphate aldolase
MFHSGGKIAVLALDHRNNMRRLLHPENEKLTTADEIADFKHEVVAALGDAPSAYLLDPLYGAAQNISNSALPGNRGLLLALEETGYSGDAIARESKILEGWDVSKIKRMGATGVKLLVYYHPQSETHRQIEDWSKEPPAIVTGRTSRSSSRFSPILRIQPGNS